METPDVNQLKQSLESLETQLISALHDQPDDDRRHSAIADSLAELKPVLDRIRPLVWMYLNRRSEAQRRQQDAEPTWGFELIRERVKRISRALPSVGGKKPTSGGANRE
jgi:hypothetical protein